MLSKLFPDFHAGIGDAPFYMVHLGRIRSKPVENGLPTRHGIELPERFDKHINLKKQVASVFDTKVCGMKRALHRVGLPLDGTHHRGIDDARNTGKLVNLVLPKLEALGDDSGGR